MKKYEIGTVVVGCILLAAGIVLRFVPGVRFSSYLCLGLAGLCGLWLALGRWAEKSRLGKLCKRGFRAGITVAFLVFGCFEAVIINQGESDLFALPVDAVIVLGAGVNGETPSLALRTRIDAAAEYIAYHSDVPVVLSGGQGPGESITEAECMRRELWTRDEDRDRRLLLEERSTSTAENFAFSKAVLEEYGIDVDTAVIGVVTNDFHMFRAKLIAQKEGMQTVGVPAELPWWWLTANYYVREAFALAKTLIFD